MSPRLFFKSRSAGVSSLLEASTAVYRLILRGLESKLGFAAALAANSIEVLLGRLVCVLLGITASLASLGLVCVALFSIESLFAGSECEFLTAVYANQCFVNIVDIGFNSLDFFFVHVLPLFVVIFLALRRNSTATFEDFSTTL